MSSSGRCLKTNFTSPGCFGHQLLDQLGAARAVGALEIGKFDDRDRSAGVAAEGLAGGRFFELGGAVLGLLGLGLGFGGLGRSDLVFAFADVDAARPAIIHKFRVVAGDVEKLGLAAADDEAALVEAGNAARPDFSPITGLMPASWG